MEGFTRWPAARTYAPIVIDEARSRGIDPAIVLGLIAAESGFNAGAYRAEPHIGDASRGLMQVLYRTAQAVGYAGEPAGLFDPVANVRAGTAYLRDRIAAHGGDVWAGVSAYNNGHGKRAPADATVCAVRNADGSCARYEAVRAGDFYNAAYVARVRQYASLFEDASAPGWPLVALGILGALALT